MEEVKCPICKGKGKINPPVSKTKVINNRIMASLLKNEGYSYRVIMRFLGYKSANSVRFLLIKRPKKK